MSDRSEYIAKYFNAVKNASTEAAKKELLLTLLNQLFASHDKFNIIGQFANGAEKSICNISRVSSGSEHGRADTQYGSVILEFENDLAKTGDHAADQLKEYLTGNWNSGIQRRFTLIASDCLEWRIYIPDYDSLYGLGTIKASQVKFEKSINTFKVDPNKPDDFYFFLDRYLFKSEPLPANLEEVRKTFGYGSDIFQSAMLEMHKAYTEIETAPEMQTSYDQWEKFLKIAYGDFKADKNVFLVHSYLSVLAKMLAYEVISGDAFIDDSTMLDIVNGEIFRRRNISNFTENDFFMWTSQQSQSIALKEAFRTIATGLSQFDFSNISEDILKGVYQELIDEDTRHSLGEHYTPDWLCTKIVSEINPKKGQRILDPSCGSGSFLKALANHLIQNNPDISLAELNDCLFGIDVHPLSVQIAKATLLMAYGKRLDCETRPLHLNIFLANTLLLPHEDVQMLGSQYRVSINDTQIDIPIKIFTDQKIFHTMVNIAEQITERDFLIKTEHTDDQMRKICQNRLKNNDIEMLQVICKLYRIFLHAKQTERDSIWAYIISNTFAPVALKKQFDVIVGNPPWLTFKDVVSSDYQDKINAIAKNSRVLPVEVALRTQLELAAVFLGHCLTYFLKPEGKLAFVLPRSFFTGDQHNQIRVGKVCNLKLVELWDLFGVSPLFNIPSCVMFCLCGNTRELKQDTISGKIFSGTLPMSNCDWARASERISITEKTIYLSHLNNRSAWSVGVKTCLSGITPYKNCFKNGATLFPRTLCFVDITQKISGSLKDRLVRVQSSETVYRDSKLPWRNAKMSGAVYTNFFFETALSKNIVPFGLNGTFLVALPIFVKEGKMTFASIHEIEETGEIETAEWFDNVFAYWEQHKTQRAKEATLPDRLNWQNKLLSQNLNIRYLVVYTASGRNAVCTVIDRTALELPFIVENTTYVFATDKLEEAQYLTAILNSSTVNKIIKPFQAGGRHIHKKILEIPFPKYDPSDADHAALVALAEKASQKVAVYIADQHFDPHGGNMDKQACGNFRNVVRVQIAKELEQIDKTLCKMLKI